MDMLTPEYNPADVERIVGATPDNLRDWRRRNTGPRGEAGANGRFKYSRADLLQIMLQGQLMPVAFGVEQAGRCASHWVYGQKEFSTEHPKGKYVRHPMELFEGQRTYLVIGHSGDGIRVPAVLSEKEINVAPADPSGHHPMALAERGMAVTVFDLTTFHANAMAFLDANLKNAA